MPPPRLIFPEVFVSTSLSRRVVFVFAACALAVCVAAGMAPARAQETPPTTTAPRASASPSPQPAPTPQTPRDDQESVRVFTEEVRLPLLAFDDYGHFDPTIEADDLLILEDGVQQQIRSLRRIPANVLLLLDTGSQMTLEKSTNTTRQIAQRLVTALRPDHQIAVMAFGDRVELLQNWTNDREAVGHVLQTKLSSGKKGGLLAQAMTAARQTLEERPAGSRHVVVVTDGVLRPEDEAKYAGALKQLLAAQASVHVISYSTLVREAIGRRLTKSPVGFGGGPPSAGLPAGTLPPGMGSAGTVRLATIDTDRQMRRWFRNYAKATEEGERRLTALAEETGGRILLATTRDEIVKQGAEVAREVGAEYVLTYTPKRPLAEARAGEYRRVEVAPRRSGLRLRTRRGYVASPPQ